MAKILNLDVIGKAYGEDGKRIVHYHVLASDYYTYWYNWYEFWKDWEDI